MSGTKTSRHLWKDKKPIGEILKSRNVDEVRAALKEENARLNSVIAWLSGAYTRPEIIQILQACQFDENDIVMYGFSRDEILDAIETGTEMPIQED